jgi:hypothetical protein
VGAVDQILGRGAGLQGGASTNSFDRQPVWLGASARLDLTLAGMNLLADHRPDGAGLVSSEVIAASIPSVLSGSWLRASSARLG